MADELGFVYTDEPDPDTCEFCGRPLSPVGWRSLVRAEITKWDGWEKCGCAKAVDRRNKQELARIQKQQEEAEAARKEAMRQKVQRLFDMSQLGRRFRNRTFENWVVTPQNKKALESAKKYAAEFDQMKTDGIGILLSGSMGTGKTHLGAAIANALINEGTPVIMNTMIGLLNKIKNAYDGEIRETEGQLINLYSTVDLLIIDDLGKERPSEWALEKLYTIINARYENLLPVVITTNYSVDKLVSRLTIKDNYETAEAIVSRLGEMCVGEEMNFEDWRLKP